MTNGRGWDTGSNHKGPVSAQEGIFQRALILDIFLFLLKPSRAQKATPTQSVEKNALHTGLVSRSPHRRSLHGCHVPEARDGGVSKDSVSTPLRFTIHQQVNQRNTRK